MRMIDSFIGADCPAGGVGRRERGSTVCQGRHTELHAPGRRSLRASPQALAAFDSLTKH